jgi:hypothetical protein
MLVFTSCHIMRLPKENIAPSPYVQLKDGKKYTGGEAERKGGIFKKDKIQIGDTAVLTRDVAFYSDGEHNYANTGKKTFAYQVLTGKVNLYRYSTTSTTTTTTRYSGGGSSTYTDHHHQISYYMQKADGAPLQSIKYKNLLPLYSPGTPEYAMLQKYRKTNNVSRYLGYGGLAAFVTGIVLSTGDNTSTVNIGNTLISTGAISMVGWFFVKFPNRGNLLKSIFVADHYHRVKGRYTREK